MRVYLDNAATTPMAPEVVDAMCDVLRNHFGNPSSTHSFGRSAKSIIETSRKTIAKYPGHELVEIDIEAPTEGWKLEDVFCVKRSCWGKTNIHGSNDSVSMDELH